MLLPCFYMFLLLETFQQLQKQSCQQVMDEAEKEYKKMSERINEGQDAMKASYAEFIEAAQASASRLLKTSIPELSQSFENLTDGIFTLWNNFLGIAGWF
ncbi:unnamed protein product [Fraxinus pennsylvanica]|uniref:Uncharacterized protein n=1 Tax=Fraxinus pennsylvanica TaxID=56036 RepID=A0AAD1ZLJ3_9LAMI|nr:unnamed protein product [Fraxinus pennsylvanica]